MNRIIRAFIAVELSPHLKETIAGIQAELKESGGDVKWVQPEICHITLKFLGAVREDQISSIRAVMDGCAGSTKPFSLPVNVIGAFPTMEKPNIIWLGLNDGQGLLTKIAGEIEDQVSAMGFPKEDRAFTPHITIGRTRAGSHKTLSQSLKTIPSPEETLNVGALTFFQSTLSSAGPTYQPLFTSPLK